MTREEVANRLELLKKELETLSFENCGLMETEEDEKDLEEVLQKAMRNLCYAMDCLNN